MGNRSASTMPTRAYGSFWRAYCARQGVSYPSLRPLQEELEQRLEALENELADLQRRLPGDET